LAEERAKLQGELDALLARQEERLRAWESAVAAQEQQLEGRKAALEEDHKR
jgi:hypothetical protein